MLSELCTGFEGLYMMVYRLVNFKSQSIHMSLRFSTATVVGTLVPIPDD